MKDYAPLRETQCPICGKLFIAAPQHIYKVKDSKVCSWGCVRKYEKENVKGKAK